MIAVAILAVFVWLGIGWNRRERSHHFRNQADRHANLEDGFRRIEQSFIKTVGALPATNPNAAPARQAAAKAAAIADYHAAMKRKYEDAIARGAFSVEPDPPESPWP